MLHFSSRKFWRSYWMQLRRSPVDQRARRAVLPFAFLLVYIAFATVFYVQLIRSLLKSGPVEQIFMAAAAVLPLIAAYLIRRSSQADSALVNLRLTPGSDAEPGTSGPVAPEIAEYLRERLVIVAALVIRAGSEAKLQTSPEGNSVATRQYLNSRLRELGSWDKLEPREQEWMSLPDGEWSQASAGQLLTWFEHLRLLRWLFGFDLQIEPLMFFPKVDAKLAFDVLRRDLGPVPSRLETWDLRVERDLATQYSVRTVAEANARGLAHADPHLEQAWQQLRAAHLGESKDLVAGHKTVSSLSDDDLGMLTAIAVSRSQYASYLISLLSKRGPNYNPHLAPYRPISVP